MTYAEYRKLEDASDIICGECIKRCAKACKKCPVRATLDYCANENGYMGDGSIEL